MQNKSIISSILSHVVLTGVLLVAMLSAPPDANACTGPPPPDMCDRQVLCGINVPSLRPIPLSSSVRGVRAVRVTMPVTLFYETYDRASCYSCDVTHTGGSISLTIDCNERGAPRSNGLVFETTVPFDPLCCGANTQIAEIDLVIPPGSDVGVTPMPYFDGGACQITGVARVNLNDDSYLEVACNEQVVSIIPESTTSEGKPMLQLQTASFQGEERWGPRIVSSGSAPSAHVTLTNESPYTFTGRVTFSSKNANSLATCTNSGGGPGQSTTFATAGGNGDAFTGVTKEGHRCDDPPDPAVSVNPTWDVGNIELGPGQSQDIPYWLRIWPGCFFGSGSQVTACVSGQFGGELEGKYRDMCVTVPIIVDYNTTYCEGEEWDPDVTSPGVSGTSGGGGAGGGAGGGSPPGGGGSPPGGGGAPDACTSDWDIVGMAPCGDETFPCYMVVMSAEDWDNDGLLNTDEIFVHFTNPDEADTDRDGLDDQAEIMMGTNPNRADTDGDGLIDGREVAVGSSPTNQDTDGDTLSDWAEVNIIDGAGTDPTVADTDEDGKSDGREARDPDLDPLEREPGIGGANLQEDADGDGLLDDDERPNSGNVQNPDTDGDGLNDGFEVYVSGTQVGTADSDGDGLSDGDEVLIHFSNPNEVDSDGDGINDDVEVGQHMSSPTRADTDRDGLEDVMEVEMYMTNPADADSDDGGATDGREVELDLDPNDPMDDDGVLNPQRGMVYLTAETGEARPIVMLRESAPDIEVADVYRAGLAAGGFQGRIKEIWRLSAPEAARNTTVRITGRLDYAVLNSAEGDPLTITELEMGVKPVDRSDDAPLDLSNTFVGEGKIRLSATPAVDVLAMHQVGVWVTGGAVVGETRGTVENPEYRVDGTEVHFTFDVVLPDLDFSRIQITHDFRALQRPAFETECRDGVDGDNDGMVDCDDPDCTMDPFCQPPESDGGAAVADGGGDAGGAGDNDAGAADTGSAGGAGGTGGANGGEPAATGGSSSSGCGCDVGGGEGPSPMSVVFLCALLLGLRRGRYHR
jgi:hypothetical protein